MASNEELRAMGITKNDIENVDIEKVGINKIATAVKFVGCLEIICSIILGIILGNTFRVGYYGYDFNTGLCIAIIVAGILGGIFILGFGEIIQKLQNIENNTKNNR